ncbi:hypothetical protein HDU93_009206 [Gonapodya sp. JEL0774]|nr:hypothetical protein HDU93_009206 [Gonapodya sp. JEL0774]
MNPRWHQSNTPISSPKPILPLTPPSTPHKAPSTPRAPRTPRTPLEELSRRQSDRQKGKSYKWEDIPKVIDDLEVDREGGGKFKKSRKSGGRRSDLGVRVVGGRVYDSVNGESCHQCRQKTMDPKIKCTNKIVHTYADGTTVTSMCTLMLDEQCLKGRYGQTIADAIATGDWHCPKCQGILKHTALAAGYSSVADYLEALELSRSKKKTETVNEDKSDCTSDENEEGTSLGAHVSAETSVEIEEEENLFEIPEAVGLVGRDPTIPKHFPFMSSELRKRPTKGLSNSNSSEPTKEPSNAESDSDDQKAKKFPKVGDKLPQSNPDYPVHLNLPPKGAGAFRRKVLDAIAKIPQPWKAILGVIYWSLFTCILIVLLYWFILGEITFEIKSPLSPSRNGFVGKNGKFTKYATAVTTKSTPSGTQKKKTPAPRKPLPPPKTFTEAELAEFDGSDPEKPVYLAFRGKVYDVSSNRDTYGKKGQGYNMFAGRDAARAFVTGCFNPEDGHLTHDLRGLTEDEVSGLKEWGDFYEKEGKEGGKYPYIGTVIHEPIPSDRPIPKPCRPTRA